MRIQSAPEYLVFMEPYAPIMRAAAQIDILEVVVITP